jgi:hypothetical protein
MHSLGHARSTALDPQIPSARCGRAGGDSMSADLALKMIAIAAGATAIAVEIMDRFAARSLPNAEERRTGALTLWMVAGMLAAVRRYWLSSAIWLSVNWILADKPSEGGAPVCTPSIRMMQTED